MTVEQMRHVLERQWPGWRGLTRVRVIHGQGEALKPALLRWCAERGISYAVDPGNPGSTRIFPTRRALPDMTIGTLLQSKGLSLSPEQDASLREARAREKVEEARRLRDEARRKAEDAGRDAVQKRLDDALWNAETARLDEMDRRQGGSGGAAE
jgi:hypothetical protein